MWYLCSLIEKEPGTERHNCVAAMKTNVNTHLKMKDIRMIALWKNFSAYPICSILTGLMLWGCASSQAKEEKIVLPEPVRNTVTVQPSSGADAINELDFHVHEYINIKTPPIPSIPDSLLQTDNITENLKEAAWKAFFESASPVAQKIVENYLASKNKEPGGHCLAVSKQRIETAYRQVHGHSLYQDLPDRMATKIYSPRQVFDLLYVSASDTDMDWKSLPEAYRGKGNAGALAYAGMGTLVDSTGIWSGELRPGAPMQVWRYEQDYEQVVKGTDVKKLDPYGHSFIFIDYVRDENNRIVGLKIADQGFQSYRPLIPRDYEVWWAVNLKV